jgi:hypothetical protein
MKTRIKSIGILSALLLAGAFALPPNAQAHAPRSRELCGVIQSIDSQNGTLAILTSKKNTSAVFALKRDTRFLEDWKFTDAGALKEGLRACVYFRSPFFGKPFVTKVVWTKQN